MRKLYVLMILMISVIVSNNVFAAVNADTLDQLDSTAFEGVKTNVKYVAKGGFGTYSTISGALNSLPTPNTTPTIIKVMPGTYSVSAPINMKSNVHLQGSGHSVTTITLSVTTNPGGIVFSEVSNAEISGFTIESTENFRDSIHLQLSDVAIRNNRFVGGRPVGIYNPAGVPAGPSQAVITENIFDWPNYYYAIYTTGQPADNSHLTVSHNKFTLKENPGFGGNGGVRLTWNSSAEIVDNIFVGDGSPVSEPVITVGSGKVFISGNIIDNIGGNGINGNSQTVIRGNTITNNAGDGIIISDGIISGNVIKGNGGAGLSGSGTPLLTGNVIKENGTGVTGIGTFMLTNNVIVGNIYYDVDCSNVTSIASFNVFDTVWICVPSSLNVKSEGTPW